jgi:hypothetical protein
MRPLLVLFSALAAFYIIGCSTNHSPANGYLGISVVALSASGAIPAASDDVGFCSVDIVLTNNFSHTSRINMTALLQSIYEGKYEDDRGAKWELRPWYLKPGYFVDYPIATMILSPYETKRTNLAIHYYQRPLQLVNSALISESNRPAIPQQLKYNIGFWVDDRAFGVERPTKIVGQGWFKVR